MSSRLVGELVERVLRQALAPATTLTIGQLAARLAHTLPERFTLLHNLADMPREESVATDQYSALIEQQVLAIVINAMTINDWQDPDLSAGERATQIIEQIEQFVQARTGASIIGIARRKLYDDLSATIRPPDLDPRRLGDLGEVVLRLGSIALLRACSEWGTPLPDADDVESLEIRLIPEAMTFERAESTEDRTEALGAAVDALMGWLQVNLTHLSLPIHDRARELFEDLATPLVAGQYE